MECNRDEASRALEIALEKLGAQDWASAKRFVAKADQLFPNLEGLPQVLAMANVQSRAQGKAEGEMDWYEILEVEASADLAAIRKQYKKMALVLHPDKNKFPGAEASFKLIQEAWSVLSDRTKREKFDLLKNMVNTSSFQQRSTTFAAQQQRSNFATYHQSSSFAAAAAQTFWTRCPSCQIQFQYGIQYLNQKLVCSRCSKDFVAVSVDNVFPGTVPLKPQRARRGMFHFPRRSSVAFAAAAAQAAANAAPPEGVPVDTSDVVQRCFNQAKKERKEKEKEKEKIAKSKIDEEETKGRGRRRKGAAQVKTRRMDEFFRGSSDTDPREIARKVTEDRVNKEPKERSGQPERESHVEVQGVSSGACPASATADHSGGHPKESPEETKETDVEGHPETEGPPSKVEEEEMRCEVNEQENLNERDDRNEHDQRDCNGENHQADQEEKLHCTLEVPDSDDELVASRRKTSRRRILEVPDSEDEDFKPTKQRVPEKPAGEKPSSSDQPAAEQQATAATRRSSRKRNVLCYRFDDYGDGGDDLDEFRSSKRPRTSTPEGSVEDDRPPPMEQAFGAYDFDADRTLPKVKKGQVWSVYNHDDTLPSWYARVTSVRSEDHISAKWLEPIKGRSQDVDKWLALGHYAACSEFHLLPQPQTLSLTMLCQEARAEAVDKNRWRIYPRSGEVWSLIRGWDRSLLAGKKRGRGFQYDFAEVLSDYTAEKGVKVAPLVRREGVFVREAAGKWQHIGEAELLSFSHRVPAVKVAEPPGSWQLDPETFARGPDEECDNKK